MSKFSNVKKRFDRAYLPEPYDYYSQRLDGLKGNSSMRQCKALCPFKPENTASFFFNNESGLFKCFSCNESGGIVHFHMLMYGFDFVDACKDLGCWR